MDFLASWRPRGSSGGRFRLQTRQPAVIPAGGARLKGRGIHGQCASMGAFLHACALLRSNVVEEWRTCSGRAHQAEAVAVARAPCRCTCPLPSEAQRRSCAQPRFAIPLVCKPEGEMLTRTFDAQREVKYPYNFEVLYRPIANVKCASLTCGADHHIASWVPGH